MKVDKSFKRPAFVAAANAVSEKFKESCHWTKVENRLKTLKKQWAIIMNLKGLSGSNFDPVNKVITLGEGSYQDYVKVLILSYFKKKIKKK
jgi:Myb/SANT-like DNA-binding domain